MNIRLLVLGAMASAIACTGTASMPAPSPARAPAPVAPVPAPVRVVAPMTATATIRDLAGGRVGTATFTDSYYGVLVSATVSGLGLGAHGIHIHEIGKCEPPFATAGGHFNPAHRHHGFKNPEGSHLGDMPNIDMPAAGQHKFEFLLPGVTVRGTNGLLDADGAAIVVHSSGDDYTTDPAGNSGSRIACGVITAS